MELTPQEPVCDTVVVRRVFGPCQDLLRPHGQAGSQKFHSSTGRSAAKRLGLRCSPLPCSGRPGLTTAGLMNHWNHAGMALAHPGFQSSGKLPAASRRGARGSPTAAGPSLPRPCPGRLWADPRRPGAPPAPQSLRRAAGRPRPNPETPGLGELRVLSEPALHELPGGGLASRRHLLRHGLGDDAGFGSRRSRRSRCFGYPFLLCRPSLANK